MKPRTYYNEHNREAATWIRNLIAAELIPDGDVDTRSITEVQPGDLDGYLQCHFFAGIAGWAVAARLAGWPDDRPIWTGSCPCQPFSVAGRGKGVDDARHLWPDFFRLIRAGRPTVVMGEQVSGKAGRAWFDGVHADMDGEAYACRAIDIPACAVDAPHIRSRLYWCAVADAAAQRLQAANSRTTCWTAEPARASIEPERRDGGGHVVDPTSIGWREGRPSTKFRSRRPTASGADVLGCGALGDAGDAGLQTTECEALDRPGRGFEGRAATQPDGSFWRDAEWINCHDGKARRTKPGSSLLVTRASGRVAVVRSGVVDADEGWARETAGEEVVWISRTAAWRGIGNAINVRLAAEVIRAFVETT